MTDPIRIPLGEEIEPRSASSDKDSLAANVFYDKGKNGTSYSVKRPGITSYITGSGQAQGIYYFNGEVFNFSRPPIYWNRVIWNGSIFVAIGYFNYGDNIGVALVSQDGINWTQSTLASHYSWFDIAWNGTYFFAVANNNTTGNVPISRSTDGITWTTYASATNGGWGGVACNGSLVVKVRPFSTNGTYGEYSTDNGVTWAASDLPASGWSSVAYNPTANKFCAVNETNNLAATSTNGINWTTATLASGFPRADIASNSTTFVTPLMNSNKCYTSTNGTTWTERTLPNSRDWYRVEWTGLRFIMLSADYIALSDDGVLWGEFPLEQYSDFPTTYFNAIGGNTSIEVYLGRGPNANIYQYLYTDFGVQHQATLPITYPYTT